MHTNKSSSIQFFPSGTCTWLSAARTVSIMVRMLIVRISWATSQSRVATETTHLAPFSDIVGLPYKKTFAQSNLVGVGYTWSPWLRTVDLLPRRAYIRMPPPSSGNSDGGKSWYWTKGVIILSPYILIVLGKAQEATYVLLNRLISSDKQKSVVLK